MDGGAFPGWNAATEKAAVLIATTSKTRAQVAKASGVSERELYRWLNAPEFQRKLDEHRAEVRDEMMRRGIARVEVRVAELEAVKNGTLKVITARAKRAKAQRAQAAEEAANDMYGLATPEEAETGLMVREVKTAGDGVSVKWAYDAAVVDSIMKLHKQVAQELGQWSDKLDATVTTRAIELVGIDADAI